MEDFNNKVEKRLKTTKVSNLMSRFAITTRETTTLAELAHLMMRFKISGVPIISSEEEMIGIVTATDLFNKMKEITDDLDVQKDPTEHYHMSVKDIMITSVYTVGEGASLYEAIKLMCEKNIHTLPVVEGKEIVGIIGRRDIINACYDLVEVI